MIEMQKATHIALLAPVPAIHLESALLTVTPNGRVAFGTTKWELINELEAQRKDMPVDVYIYASHGNGCHDGAATWRATYVGYAKDKWEAAPYRPVSTATDSDNGEVFWLVEGLRRVSNESVALTQFTGFGKKKPYGPDFVPRGPLLVEHPL
jgi:hypothetical protein